MSLKYERTTIYDEKEGRFIRFCLALAIYTSSFDIVGIINLFGFNFRLTQLAILPLLVGMVFMTLSKEKVVLPKGMVFLIIWVILQTAFSFRSPSLKNALGYDLWLIFDVLMIFATCFYINKAYDFQWLMKTYLNSFEFIAVVGLIQMFLYAIGINFFVVQHWNTWLARINGFSYEPSYYATYLIMGYVICSYLVLNQNEELFEISRLRIKHILITLALFLSSSRMGWLMIALWIGLKVILLTWKLFTSEIEKKKVLLASAFPMSLALIYIVIKFLTPKIDLTIFLNGLGVMGKAGHSTHDRIDRFRTCLDIFMESPFLGYGLGGVDPMIAKHEGFVYSTMNNGLASTLGEIIVASGLISILFFVMYFKSIITFQSKDPIHIALVLSLIFEIIILCFNQNILRPYVWMNIGVLSCSYVVNKNVFILNGQKMVTSCRKKALNETQSKKSSID